MEIEDVVCNIIIFLTYDSKWFGITTRVIKFYFDENIKKWIFDDAWCEFQWEILVNLIMNRCGVTFFLNDIMKCLNKKYKMKLNLKFM